MSVRQLGRAACRSYLVACERSREALLVDPLLDDAEEVEGLLEREGFRVRMVVDTHTHADHHSGGALFAERLAVPYALHEAHAVARAGERLRDGERVAVGDLEVEVIHTPGHTPDSATFRCGGDLLTGDFLFLAQEGAGRLDLPGGDAGAHWDSLQRLAALGDDLRVLPGHDYRELAESTLGAERRRNPRFQRVTREEYVAWQKAIRQETPAWMLEVIAANLGSGEAHAAHHGGAGGSTAAAPALPGLDAGAACGTGPGACASIPTGRVPLIAPGASHQRLREGLAGEGRRPFLLDVREPWEFAGPRGRHAVGAVSIPLGALEGSLEGIPPGEESEVHVICKTGSRSAAAAEFLIEKGWRRVFSVAGGTDRWASEGLPIE